MIMETGKGMTSFLLLLMLFSATFSLFNMAIGVDDPGIDDHTGDDDFPFRSALSRHIMQGLSNSFGDLSMPEFSKWTDIQAKFPMSSWFMITLGFGLYFSNIIFMLVLNLNLLIAIISEVYDSVRSF